MSRHLNGTDQYLKASFVPYTNAIGSSMAVWVRFDTITGGVNQAILGSFQDAAGRKWHMYSDGAGNLRATYFDGTNTLSVEFNLTQFGTTVWHLAVMKLIDDSATTPGNAILAASIDGANFTLDVSEPAVETGLIDVFTAGLRDSNNDDWPMDGQVAEIAVWDGYELTNADVANLFSGGSGGAGLSANQVGSPANYWRILGDNSPEPAQVGATSFDLEPSGGTVPPKGASHPNIDFSSGGGGSSIVVIQNNFVFS